MARIKKIKLGDNTYEVCDAAAQAAAEAAQATADTAQATAKVKVATINGYSYDKINNGTVTFADTAVTTSEIETAITNIGKSSN
jgi:hypothetical protein